MPFIEEKKFIDIKYLLAQGRTASKQWKWHLNSIIQ